MNEQDNKPDRTAMQEAIDEINNEAHKYPPGAGERNALQSMLPKLVKLRDTVEKEQRKSDWINGFIEDLSPSIFDNGLSGMMKHAELRYNEKHPNHGK